jgi:hypothetical protein
MCLQRGILVEEGLAVAVVELVEVVVVVVVVVQKGRYIEW